MSWFMEQHRFSMAHLPLLAVLAVAAVVDGHTRRIPNRLTYPVLILGCGLAAGHSAGILSRWSVGLPDGLLGAAIVFCLMMVLWLGGTTGGGDVKLATVIGACLGWQLGISAIAWTYTSACLFAIFSAVMQHGAGTTICVFARFIVRRLMPHAIFVETANEQRILQSRMPMGVHFALGTLVALWGGQLL